MWFSSFRNSTAAIPPAPWSCTNLHPLMSVRTYCLLFLDQVQRCADLRGDQTCSRHSSLACQEVEGRTCIWLQRRTQVEKMLLSFTSDCCARGGRTLYYRETPGCIYRVLNLHGDAFLLEHSEHRGINSFNLCTRAQHQNLCTEKRKPVKRGALQNDPQCGSFSFLLPIFGSSMWNRETLSSVISL